MHGAYCDRQICYRICIIGVRNATTQLDSKMEHTSVPDRLQLYLLTCLDVIKNNIYVTQCVHFLVCNSVCHNSITLYIRTLTNWVSCSYGGSQVTRPSGVARYFVWGGSTNSVEVGQRRERTGIWGGSPIVRGLGGSCNLVQ